MAQGTYKAKQIVVSGVEDAFHAAVDRYCEAREIGISAWAREVLAREIGFDLSGGKALQTAQRVIKGADPAMLEALRRLIEEREADQ